MTSPEPSTSSISSSSPILSVPSQNYNHQDHHTTTHPTSCGPLLALDTRYEESDTRTSLHALPFPHPKWRIDPDTGAVYEDASVVLEVCEVDLEDVRPSIESAEEETGTKRKRTFKDDETVKSKKKKTERHK